MTIADNSIDVFEEIAKECWSDTYKLRKVALHALAEKKGDKTPEWIKNAFKEIQKRGEPIIISSKQEEIEFAKRQTNKRLLELLEKDLDNLSNDLYWCGEKMHRINLVVQELSKRENNKVV